MFEIIQFQLKTDDMSGSVHIYIVHVFLKVLKGDDWVNNKKKKPKW